MVFFGVSLGGISHADPVGHSIRHFEARSFRFTSAIVLGHREPKNICTEVT